MIRTLENIDGRIIRHTRMFNQMAKCQAAWDAMEAPEYYESIHDNSEDETVEVIDPEDYEEEAGDFKYHSAKDDALEWGGI